MFISPVFYPLGMKMNIVEYAFLYQNYSFATKTRRHKEKIFIFECFSALFLVSWCLGIRAKINSHFLALRFGLGLVDFEKQKTQ